MNSLESLPLFCPLSWSEQVISNPASYLGRKNYLPSKNDSQKKSVRKSKQYFSCKQSTFQYIKKDKIRQAFIPEYIKKRPANPCFEGSKENRHGRVFLIIVLRLYWKCLMIHADEAFDGRHTEHIQLPLNIWNSKLETKTTHSPKNIPIYLMT